MRCFLARHCRFDLVCFRFDKINWSTYVTLTHIGSYRSHAPIFIILYCTNARNRQSKKFGKGILVPVVINKKSVCCVN